jgi:exonuclease III
MRFGAWNVRSLYRAGSFTAANRELARCKLDLVGVQEVRWDREGTVRAGDYNFFYGKGNENHQLGTGFFVHHIIVSAFKKVELLVIGCHI